LEELEMYHEAQAAAIERVLSEQYDTRDDAKRQIDELRHTHEFEITTLKRKHVATNESLVAEQARARASWHKTDEEVATLRIQLVRLEQDKRDLNDQNAQMADK
jgi:hypothetical protein